MRCHESELRLVDAAHILPVGAPGSSEHVRNGIALAPTYHRAFDAGLIYLNEQRRMMLNRTNFRARKPQSCRSITHSAPGSASGYSCRLIRDKRPTPEFIRLANRFRRSKRDRLTRGLE